MTWWWLCLGAAVGAPTRYLVDRAVQSRSGTAFPWGTLVVNVCGSLVLGVLFGASRNAQLPASVLAGVGTGFCGALTTYSTFGYETVQLAEDGARRLAVTNTVVSLGAGVAAAAAGYAVGVVVWA